MGASVTRLRLVAPAVTLPCHTDAPRSLRLRSTPFRPAGITMEPSSDDSLDLFVCDEYPLVLTTSNQELGSDDPIADFNEHKTPQAAYAHSDASDSHDGDSQMVDAQTSQVYYRPDSPSDIADGEVTPQMWKAANSTLSTAARGQVDKQIQKYTSSPRNITVCVLTRATSQMTCVDYAHITQNGES